MKKYIIILNALMFAAMALLFAGCGEDPLDLLEKVPPTTTTTKTAPTTTTTKISTTTTAPVTTTTGANTSSTSTNQTTTTIASSTTTTDVSASGKALFVSNNCVICHAAWSTGSPLFPLATTTEASLKTAISTQLAMSAYSYLTPAQITALVKFMQTGQ